ncbi:DUF222 domain-containing protein, partial [Cryptosporangium aurantiacum]
MDTGLGRLAAAAAVVAGEDFTGGSDGALCERVRELYRIRSQVDAALVAAVGVVHQRGAVEYDGAVSTKSWLRARLHVSPVESSELVDVARHLPDDPAFAETFRAGRVSRAHVLVAARLAKKVGPDLADEAADALLGPALTMDPAALKHVSKRIEAYLRPETDAPDEDGEEPDEADRAVYHAQTFGGTWDLAGTLTPEAGALAQTYLNAASGRRDAEDDRSPCQRRHDALAELFRLGLDTAHLPTHGGEQPHLAVLVHARDLQHSGRAGRKRRRLAPVRFDGEDVLTAGWAYLDDDPAPVPPDWAEHPDDTGGAGIDWDAALAVWADELDLTPPHPRIPAHTDAGLPDPGLPGTAPTDTSLANADLAGASLADAGLADVSLADADADADLAGGSVADAGLADVSLADAGLADAGLADAGLADAGLADAGLADAGLADADLAGAGVPGAGLPEWGAARDLGLAEAIAGVTGRRSGLPTEGTGGITEYGGLLSPEAVRRLACDAGINRVVLDPADVPINAGRLNRVPPPAMRRVLVARDGGCRFHGCDRPPAWTH